MEGFRFYERMLIITAILMIVGVTCAHAAVQPYESPDFKVVAQGPAPTGIACFAMVFNYFQDQGVYADADTGKPLNLNEDIGSAIAEGSGLWKWINGRSNTAGLQELHDAAYKLNEINMAKAQYFSKKNTEVTCYSDQEERKTRFDYLLNNYLINGVPVIIQMKPFFSQFATSFAVLTGYDPDTKTVYYSSPKSGGFSATVSYDDFIEKYFYLKGTYLVSRWNGCWQAFYHGVMLPGDHRFSFYLQDFNRSYILQVPETYTGSTPVPLVVDFHGLYQRASIERNVTGFMEYCEEKNFIVAYPEGVGFLGMDAVLQSWNANAPGGQQILSWANAMGIDDVAFAVAVVNDIKRQLHIDSRRVYVTGLSQGGSMALLCAHQRGDVFASVASVSAAILLAFEDYNPSRPVAVLNVHSYDDDVVAYYGNSSIGVAPIEDTTYQWAVCGGCALVPVIESPAGELIDLEPAEKLTKYPDGENGVEVWLYSLHTYPGLIGNPHNAYSYNYHGETKDERRLYIASLEWEFFEKFPRPF